MPFEPEGDLGKCCSCGENDAIIILMLDHKAPAHGGWGCAVCGVDGGAVAVLCEQCELEEKPLASICIGYPSENQRLPIAELTPESFTHDMRKHDETD